MSKHNINERPYFLWDDDLTWGQLKNILDDPSHQKFAYYLGKTLREANYRDVWELITLKFFVKHFFKANPYLGRQRGFWEFLVREWGKMGLLPQ